MKKIYLILIMQMAAYTLIAQPISPSIIGAELTADLIEPDKVNITLYSYYNSQSVIPEVETAILVGEGQERQIVQLKKINELIVTKQIPVTNTAANKPPATIYVVYSGVSNMTSSSADIIWTCSSSFPFLNNIDIPHDQKVALLVRINAKHADRNNLPMLQDLPIIRTTDKTNSRHILTTIENGETDITEVVMSTPLLINSTLKSKNVNAFIKANYRQGFSIERPMAEKLIYNKYFREMVIDAPSLGNYLITINISDYRNGLMLSEHQAMFIIQSTL